MWLNYAVCACEADSCGWQGWIVESAFVRREGDEDLLLPSDSQLNCPECPKPLFRTEVSYRFEPSEDQKPHLIPGVDYQETPMEYYGESGPDIAVTPPMRRGEGVSREIGTAALMGRSGFRTSTMALVSPWRPPVYMAKARYASTSDGTLWHISRGRILSRA